MPLVTQPTTWQRFLVRAGLEIGGAVAAFLFDQLDVESTPEEIEDLAWARVVFEYSRDTPAGTTEDLAQFSMDVVNITGGNIDSSWTLADLTSLSTAIGTFNGATTPYRAPGCRFTKTKIYRMSFRSPLNPSKPFNDTGPPLIVLDYTDLNGTGTGVLPYQVAMSVTERTAWPGHWGRFYLPSPAANTLDAYGRFTATARDGVANATEALYEAWQAADFFPVVPVTQHALTPAYGLLSVSRLSIDDIPDVQRRRRARTVFARSERGL